jgi:hypothetical protein
MGVESDLINLKLFVGAAVVVASLVSAPLRAENLPSFKVAARYLTATILLVPPNTTDADLTNLVNALRSARRGGSLAKFFPPTTPKAPKGPFTVVMLFVMSDTAWATIPRLKAFVDPSISQISAAEREFGRRVLAYYFFTGLANQEFGTLGYEDEGHTYTKNFKKLF